MPQSHQKIQDPRISQYIEATERLKHGDYNIDMPVSPVDEVGKLGQALRELANTLEKHYRELQKLDEITSEINAGLLLDDILENVYHNFQALIPYNRIGFALIENEKPTTRVRACWAKSDQPRLTLCKGYSAPLAGSSLETILANDQPRIINNLEAYLAQKPESDSTRLIVEEGMRSSLTCPLIANGIPVGFIFFSSIQPNTYADVHVDIFKRIAGQLSIIVDKGRLVSELSTQKAAIEVQNKELQRLNELKNTFLGIAAHDLRGPIGFIQMITHFLSEPSEDVSPAEMESFIKDINQQTTHMLVLIDDLLDVTQIEAGKLTLKLGTVALDQFMAAVVARHAKVAASKGTRVILETTPHGSVMADPARLQQVVDNLISNAVKYSPPGSMVKVGVRQTGDGWRINVQDEGPGLTAEDRRHLFQNFARLSARPTGGEKSIGLGLAITRRMVEAHGGEIGVDSEPGRGANFWFTLPAQ
ncbi:MAG: GAF domain-containing protein [Anaerolineae bacterium]|nr:GAF domain-containing protein [Anaerolineae bacterium]